MFSVLFNEAWAKPYFAELITKVYTAHSPLHAGVEQAFWNTIGEFDARELELVAKYQCGYYILQKRG